MATTGATMNSRSDRDCLRGCVVDGVHFATCPSYGIEGGDCPGCKPVPAADGALICDRCIRRLRGLLRDTPDLLGRMRSLADPARAAVFDRPRVASTGSKPFAPLDDDLADALQVVESVLDAWHAYGRDLGAIVNQHRIVSWMCDQVLTVHPPVGGIREAWSVLDAMRQWGVERREPQTAPVDEVVEDRVVERIPIPEWSEPGPHFDPLLKSKDAARRAKVTERQLRRWVDANVLIPVARLRDNRGSVTRWFRASEVDAAAKRMRDRRHAGRPAASVPPE